MLRAAVSGLNVAGVSTTVRATAFLGGLGARPVAQGNGMARVVAAAAYAAGDSSRAFHASVSVSGVKPGSGDTLIKLEPMNSDEIDAYIVDCKDFGVSSALENLNKRDQLRLVLAVLKGKFEGADTSGVYCNAKVGERTVTLPAALLLEAKTHSEIIGSRGLSQKLLGILGALPLPSSS